MNTSFYEQINQINLATNPIQLAWRMSLAYLNLEDTIPKIFEDALLNKVELLQNNNSYHNQYHFAHVMLGSAYFLKEEIKEDIDDKAILLSNALPLLLASIFHDAGHPGRVNNYPYELENQSINFFKQYCLENNLEKAWNSSMITWQKIENCVEELITATEFKEQNEIVLKNYIYNEEETIDNTYIKINVLKMILIESDILLSVLEKTGLKQTEKMLLEHNITIKNQSEIEEKWLNFLHAIEDTHYTISKASKNFDIKKNINQIFENLYSMKNPVKAKNLRHLKQLIQIEIKIHGNNCSLNHIDVSQVSAMNNLFAGLDFTGDISKWDTSNVKNMECMFLNSKFNGDISQWDVENVEDMSYMFCGAEFNKDLSNWTPYQAKIEYMFPQNDIKRPYWSVYNLDERKKEIDAYVLEKKLNNDLSTKNNIMPRKKI